MRETCDKDATAFLPARDVVPFGVEEGCDLDLNLRLRQLVYEFLVDAWGSCLPAVLIHRA